MSLIIVDPEVMHCNIYIHTHTHTQQSFTSPLPTACHFTTSDLCQDESIGYPGYYAICNDNLYVLAK